MINPIFLMLSLAGTPAPVPIDYCEGYTKCSFDEHKLEIDVSDHFWLGRIRKEDIAQRAFDYCQTHVGAEIIIHIQGGTAKGQCDE